MPVWKFTGESQLLEELVDASLDLGAYYQALENFLIYLRATDGVELEDFATWLATNASSVEDLGAALEAYFQSLEDQQVSLSTVATGYKDLQSYLVALAIELKDFACHFQSAGDALNNIHVYLSAGSSTVYNNLGIFLWASNGLVTDQNMGLTLMAIRRYQAAYAGTYQRIASITRRL